jgi:hypothetical protein
LPHLRKKGGLVDWKFILGPLPLIVFLTYSFAMFGTKVGDYAFHSTYEGGGTYPSGVAWIIDFIAFFMPRAWALHFFTVLVAVALPYILIFQITKNALASWVYVYGSNIAGLLYFLWFAPQATIQLFMLASVAWPPFLAVFLLTGYLFHSSWSIAWLLASTYILIRQMKADLVFA